MNRLLSNLALSASLLLLSACASTPWRHPDIGLPSQHDGQSLRGDAALHSALDYPASDVAADPWWNGFADPGLDALIAEVLTHNTDLASAALRVHRARLQAGLSHDARRPNFSGQLNHSQSHQLDSGQSDTRNNSIGLAVNWEVDLWNRLALAADAADWEAHATHEDREATALSLVGTAANLYWTLGQLNQRIALGQDSLERSRKTRELVAAQFQAGAVSRLELREIEQTLESQQATLAALQQQRQEQRQALALLLDGKAWPQERERQDLADIQSPPIAPGLPAELLGRRPDLRAAELRLRASLVTIDSTRRSYYPVLSLTGALGSSSSALGEVLKNPVATLGAGLVLPFLNFNQRKLDIAIAQTDYELAANSFRQTLLGALSEVNIALSARDSWQEQTRALQASFEHAQQIENLYEVRYRAGAVALRVWLDAQESRRNAELALTQARLSQLQNDVGLFLALGGSARQGRDAGSDQSADQARISPDR